MFNETVIKQTHSQDIKKQTTQNMPGSPGLNFSVTDSRVLATAHTTFDWRTRLGPGAK